MNRRNDKLSEGEFLLKNAPKTCDFTLIYNGEVFVSDPYMDGLRSYGLAASQNKSHSKRNLFQCMCFSGKSITDIFSLDSCNKKMNKLE